MLLPRGDLACATACDTPYTEVLTLVSCDTDTCVRGLSQACNPQMPSICGLPKPKIGN